MEGGGGGMKPDCLKPPMNPIQFLRPIVTVRAGESANSGFFCDEATSFLISKKCQTGTNATSAARNVRF